MSHLSLQEVVAKCQQSSESMGASAEELITGGLGLERRRDSNSGSDEEVNAVMESQLGEPSPRGRTGSSPGGWSLGSYPLDSSSPGRKNSSSSRRRHSSVPSSPGGWSLGSYASLGDDQKTMSLSSPKQSLETAPLSPIPQVSDRQNLKLLRKELTPPRAQDRPEFRGLKKRLNRSFPQLSISMEKKRKLFSREVQDDDNLLTCGNVLKFTVFFECPEGSEMEEARRIFHYDIPDDQVGQGAFGKVYIATKIPEGTKFAVKVYAIKRGRKIANLSNEYGRGALIESLHEIMVMKAIKGHPNFVMIVEHFMINHFIYVVMEKEDDDMASQLELAYPKGMSEPKARRWFLQIVKGISYMHELGIVHNDIKPDNIMIKKLRENKTICKITDFGMSRFLPEASKGIKGGRRVGKDRFNPSYVPPDQDPLEVLPHGQRRLKTILTTTTDGTPTPIVQPSHMGISDSKVNFKAIDVLDLGDSLLMMLGIHSLRFYTRQEVMTWAPQGYGGNPVTISIEARNLIGALLWHSPEERITTQEMLYPSWKKQAERRWLLLPFEEPGFIQRVQPVTAPEPQLDWPF